MAKKKKESSSIISEIIYNNTFGTPQMANGGGVNSMSTILGDTASFAGTGLQFGSMFGPEGSVIGAGVGAAVGLGAGLIQNHQENILKDKQNKFEKALNTPLPVSVVNPYGQYADGGKIKNISKSDIEKEYLSYIRQQEGDKAGYKNGKYYPFKSVEGGDDTFGFGHKLSKIDKNKYSNGVSEQEVINLFYKDVLKHSQNVEHILKNKGFTDEEIKNLPKKLYFGLIDYSYTGVLNQYDKLLDGIKNGDLETVKKESNISYKNPNTGEMVALTKRSNALKENYLIPGMKELIKQNSPNKNIVEMTDKNKTVPNDKTNVVKNPTLEQSISTPHPVENINSPHFRQYFSGDEKIGKNVKYNEPGPFSIHHLENGGITAPSANINQESSANLQNNKLWINIQRGELEVNKDGKVVREFDGPRYHPHEKKQSKEPHGNFVQAEKDNIIIPKKYAKDYKEGDNIRKQSILEGVLNNQKQNPTPVYQMKDGGFVKFDINQIPFMATGGLPGNTVNLNPNNNWLNIFPKPGDNLSDISSLEVPGLNTSSISMASNNELPYIDTIKNNNNDNNDNHNNNNNNYNLNPSSLLNEGVRDVGILGQLLTKNPVNYLPHANLESQDYINQMPDKVNIQSNINEMNRSFNTAEKNNRKNSPGVANANNANLFAEQINQTNNLMQNKFNQENQMKSNKLGLLADDAKQREKYNQGAYKEYTQENQQDQAARNKMLFSALSNQNDISNKQQYSQDTYKIINAMFKQYSIDPTSPYAMQELIKARPELFNQYNLAVKN